MAVNNEYSNIATIYSDRNKKQPLTSDEIRASMYAHGVSIFEVKKSMAGGKSKKILF